MNQKGFGLYGYIIAGAIAVAIIGGVYLAITLHFKSDKDTQEGLQATINDKNVVITELNIVIVTKDVALAKKDEQLELKELEVNGLLDGMVTLTTSIAKQTEEMNKVRAEAQESQRIFAEHDVPKLMEAKPAWMTKLMQKATVKAWAGLAEAVNQ